MLLVLYNYESVSSLNLFTIQNKLFLNKLFSKSNEFLNTLCFGVSNMNTGCIGSLRNEVNIYYDYDLIFIIKF